MKNLNSFLIFLLIGIVLNGCRKDEDSSPGTGSQTGNQITTSFSGKVLDLQGSPMQGVQVSVGGKVVSTDANGIYNIQNVSVNSDRAVLTADKAGYWNQQKGIIP